MARRNSNDGSEVVKLAEAQIAADYLEGAHDTIAIAVYAETGKDSCIMYQLLAGDWWTPESRWRAVQILWASDHDIDVVVFACALCAAAGWAFHRPPQDGGQNLIRASVPLRRFVRAADFTRALTLIDEQLYGEDCCCCDGTFPDEWCDEPGCYERLLIDLREHVVEAASKFTAEVPTVMELYGDWTLVVDDPA